ncbi:cobalamin biosynthesis protein [Tateyamaria omphalii]|uniref:CobE/GbiG C-terminal domain-containing protein n=1 Tax=Tateyamaria omphalii TaxID=299262 RepID=A0A1P8N0I2_9RHOB|nr:cobalamin biosynthesis protein [Tateyamaria omphalii]APX13831.1 hypothetical protein BWR18_10980 [Tateyamaria omphalii]
MIVAGFGFTSRATAQSLTEALRATGYDGPLDHIATPHDKVAHPAMLDFASARGLGIMAVQPGPLAEACTETQSRHSREARHTGSVAEAAALAAARPGAKLIVSRQVSHDRMATCAIAQGPDT